MGCLLKQGEGLYARLRIGAVVLADQPLIGAADLTELVGAFKKRPRGNVVVPVVGVHRVQLHNEPGSLLLQLLQEDLRIGTMRATVADEHLDGLPLRCGGSGARGRRRCRALRRCVSGPDCGRHGKAQPSGHAEQDAEDAEHEPFCVQARRERAISAGMTFPLHIQSFPIQV